MSVEQARAELANAEAYGNTGRAAAARKALAAAGVEAGKARRDAAQDVPEGRDARREPPRERQAPPRQTAEQPETTGRAPAKKTAVKAESPRRGER